MIVHWKCPACGIRGAAVGHRDWQKCSCGVVHEGGVGLWETKTKGYLQLHQMETSHINNCIAMILTQPDWRPGYGKLLIEELERRQTKQIWRDP